MTIRDDRSYLVTGGLWGLGWEVARWLVAQGARSLVLAGRTPLRDPADWDTLPNGTRAWEGVRHLRALEADGVAVTYWPLDVADRDALQHHLARYPGPPIAGVVHAASVWRGADGGSLVRPLLQLDAAAVRAVLRPKVLGSWALHEALAGQDLDFFVSFSSAASLLGSAGQGNYAAAGAFLDALAHHQRRSGQTGISINWGAVSERGFGATEKGQKLMEYWESRGIQRLTVAEVLTALAWALGQGRSQVGIMKLDWPRLRRAYPALMRRPWISAFASGDRANDNANRGASDRTISRSPDDTASSRISSPPDGIYGNGKSSSKSDVSGSAHAHASGSVNGAPSDDTRANASGIANEGSNGRATARSNGSLSGSEITHQGDREMDHQGGTSHQNGESPQSPFVRLLKAAPSGERRSLLEAHVREQVALVMGLESAHSVDGQRGLFDMGMDSLMALELKTRLQDSLHCTLPATIAFEQPSVRAIAAYLHRELLGAEQPDQAAQDATPSRAADDILARIAMLSDDEVDRRLSGETV